MTNTILFKASTVQANVLKALSDVLKETLTQVNLIITKDGISCLTDCEEKYLINLNLYADKFEEYIFNSEKPLVVGLMTDYLNKILKTIKNTSNILIFYVNSNNLNEFVIQIGNKKENIIGTYRLEILDVEDKKLKNMKELDYTFDITILSSKFLKIVKECKSFGSNKDGKHLLDLKCIKNELIFSSEGKVCKSQINIQNEYSNIDNKTKGKGKLALEDNFNIKVNPVYKNEDLIVQGLYNLNFLELFAKANTLSTYLTITMNNDNPLILKYNIGQLGDILFLVNQYLE